jgi:hypothetical protein
MMGSERLADEIAPARLDSSQDQATLHSWLGAHRRCDCQANREALWP